MPDFFDFGYKRDKISDHFNFKRILGRFHPPLFKKQKGFTLIELLIVLAIMSILALISLVSYENAGARAELKNAAVTLKTDLRKLQNQAISGQKNPNADPVPGHCLADSAADNTLGVYLVFTAGGLYDTWVGDDDFTGPANRSQCWVYINNSAINRYPWEGTDVEITGIGSSAGPCFHVIIKFLPLNNGVNLNCDGPWDFDGNTGNLPAGVDRVYMELQHTASGDPLTYRVYVTNGGQIYDERQP
jgi:prepilin-type N-terminal cleavage/methylation domain-containing protein